MRGAVEFSVLATQLRREARASVAPGWLTTAKDAESGCGMLMVNESPSWSAQKMSPTGAEVLNGTVSLTLSPVDTHSGMSSASVTVTVMMKGEYAGAAGSLSTA